MIILRYLAKEMVKSAVAVLFILLLVAILNKFSSLMSKAAMGEIPPSVLLELILLHIPELLAFLMPLSLFLGMLLSLGKLYAQQEMTAYFACGFSWKALVWISFLVSFCTLLVVACLTLWIVPLSQNAKESIITGQKTSLMIQSLSPGKFHQVPGKQMFFYFEAKSQENNKLKNLFIADSKVITTAKQGEIIEKKGFWYLELQKGHRYQGAPGEKTFEVLHFEKYGTLLDVSPGATHAQYHRNTPTNQLFASKEPSYLAELQWRFSVPLTVPILALWGLCLSRVSPREGRFGKMLPAILIFITYFQLLSLSKRWIISGLLPNSIGLWWVHLVFGAIGFFWLLQQSGYWQRKSYAKT